MRRAIVVFVVCVALGSCVNGSPMAPAVCEPVDTMAVGPYTATICLEIR